MGFLRLALIATTATLSMATSCVRFVTVERRYTAPACATGTQALPQSWQADQASGQFRLDEGRACPGARRQDYRLALASGGEGRVRLHWSPRSDRACDLALEFQFPCRRNLGLEQCLALSPDGSPARSSDATVRAAIDRAARELEQGLLPRLGGAVARRADAEGAPRESSSPFDDRCDP